MAARTIQMMRSEEHTSELQSLRHLVCRLLLEKNKLDGIRRSIASGKRPRLCGGSRPRRLERTRPLLSGDEARPGFLFFLNEGTPPEISSLPPHRSFPT